MKNKFVISIIFLVIMVTVIGGISIYMWLQQPEPYLQAGDRVFYPDARKYGYVEYSWDWPDYLPTGIHYDDGTNSPQISAKSVKKLNDTKYWEIADFPMYPSPVRGWYAESFKSYHAHPPINDIEGYCIDVYGNYSDRFTCYIETDEEIVYYPVSVLNVVVWKLQKVLDDKDNLNKTIIKSRKESQSYHNYTTINYPLLKAWMDYYGLKYNNRSLAIDDFDEIKNNSMFMSEYCSVYGFSGYDRGRGCYRIY